MLYCYLSVYSDSQQTLKTARMSWNHGQELDAEEDNNNKKNKQIKLNPVQAMF